MLSLKAILSLKAMAAHGSRQKLSTSLPLHMKAMKRDRAESEWVAHLLLSQQGQLHDSTPRRRIAWLQSTAFLDESMTQRVA